MPKKMDMLEVLHAAEIVRNSSSTFTIDYNLNIDLNNTQRGFG